jgi:hypothetical protein
VKFKSPEKQLKILFYSFVPTHEKQLKILFYSFVCNVVIFKSYCCKINYLMDKKGSGLLNTFVFEITKTIYSINSTEQS